MRSFKTMAAITVAVMLALPAAAQDRVFKGVYVEAGPEAFDNALAADFWADLETDLETAIKGQLFDRTVEANEDGHVLLVDIDEVAMADSFEAAFGADSTLVGKVVLKNSDGTHADAYELTVRVDRAGDVEMTDDGMFVNQVDVEQAYAKMIKAFADNVVDRVK